MQLANLPPWLNATLQNQIRQTVVDQLAVDPLDRSSLDKARQALEANPWIQSIERIERTTTSVEVYAQYRVPAALVRMSNGCRLIDAQGVLLPGLYRARGYPVIEGVAVPAPHDGRPWPGPQIQAGLATARLMASQPFAGQIRGYDVSFRDDRNQPDPRGCIRVVLWTGEGRDPQRDPHVVWGLPPGQERTIEPDATVKLQRLAEVQQACRSIDAGKRIVEIYGGATFVRQPADDQSSPTRYTWVR